MKCRYIEDVSNTPIVVSASRVGAISLAFNLLTNLNVTSFSICCQRDAAGSVYWLTVWTRKEGEYRPRMNPRLDLIYPSLSILDKHFIGDVALYVQDHYDEVLSEIVALYESGTSEREVNLADIDSRARCASHWEEIPWWPAKPE